MDRHPGKSELLAAILVCPGCHAAMPIPAVPDHRCGCGRRHLGAEGRWNFADKAPAGAGDALGSLKEAVKNRAPALYRFLIHAVSPVSAVFPARQLLAGAAPGATIVNLGAGTSRVRADVINVDLAAYPTVDVMADLTCLPFRSGSVDLILNIAVLEHVTDPRAVVREFLRVLKPGGRVRCFVPFIQGFHSSPHDYQRYTRAGLRHLFGDFVIERQTVYGPTSGMLWILQEWLALVLSLGLWPLYTLILPLTWILSPLKYLDLILRHHPAAEHIATGFMIEARRP